MHIVIIGNGITGITAALTIRRLQPDYLITIISAESGRFFSRTALMYAYMGHIKYQHLFPYEEWFWQEKNFNLMQALVTDINAADKKICLDSGNFISYDKLLLATGSVPATYNWPGQHLKGVQGFYSLQDLQLLERNSLNCKKAVIVGGGLIGVELAEMLHSRGISVTILVRHPHYWGNMLPAEEGELVGNHIASFGITLQLNTKLEEIIGSETGKVKAVKTTAGEILECDLVCLATGVRPNISVLANTVVATDVGILVNRFQETSQPGIYAAGDCAQFREPETSYMPIEQLWYTGRMQGETAGYNLCGNKIAYQRGIWFNSAKFFQIEFQTYGFVPARLSEDEETLFWQHPKGKKCIRLNYKKNSGQVTGLNLLGIRYRHEVCENWLKQKATIRQVLTELHQANFDPEFSETYEHHLQTEFNNRHPENPVPVKRKKGRFGLFL